MQKNIGIIVVSYHNAEMTQRYVTKELPKLTTPYTLVVVNVASNYEESQQLADACRLCLVDEKHPINSPANGYLIWDKENLGYAKGNNKGVRFLNSIGTFTHYLFSNDDIEINHVDILSVLVSTMDRHQDVACVGPRVVGIDGQEQSPHDRYISPYRLIGWRLFPYLRKRNVHSTSSEVLQPKARYTYWVCGAFMMVEAQSFLDARMFDERTFLYFEEAILSERLKLIDKKIYYEPSVEVLHYEGESSTSNTKLQYERISRKHYYRMYRKVNLFVVWLCDKLTKR